MLARGVYPPPSQFEAWFLSGAHTERDVDTTVKAPRGAGDAKCGNWKSGIRHGVRPDSRILISHLPISGWSNLDAEHGARRQRDVLAFGRRNRAAATDQDAEQRAFHAAEDAADDRADARAAPILPASPLMPSLSSA